MTEVGRRALRDDEIIELIVAESVLRRELGEDVHPADYFDRFPRLAARLRDRFASDSQTSQRVNLELKADSPLAETRWHHSQSTVQHLAPGTRFGDYVVVGEIARGGMGVVHRARHVTLNRTVALKMILGGRLASEGQVQRFYAEAEAAARLEHSGIVPIYEIGCEGDQHFFAMGFVDGDSLAQLVKAGPLPPREAARLVREIAIAVQYAHDRGIIHRDLKPSNILLDGEGHPKVTDFGLAKITDRDTGLSTTGDVMGTPSYMSPEQATGKIHEVGRPADVYSLGAILYCLLTGRPPFQAASVLETLQQVQQVEAVSPRVLNPAIPRDLDTITLKCLQKPPTKRYASAQELADDLGRFLDEQPIQARPVGRMERAWRWCRRNPLATGLIVSSAALVAVALAAVDSRNRLDSANLSRQAALDVANAQTYFSLVSEVREMAASPRPGWTWEALEKLKAAAAVPTQARKDLDLRNLAARTLMQVDLRELAVLEPAQGMLLRGIAFDAQGRRLAVGKQKGGFTLEVFLFDANTLQPISTLSHNTAAESLAKLMSFDKKYQEGVRAVAWSPDGRHLAVGSRMGSLFVWDMTNAEGKAVSWQGHGNDVKTLAFSADGHSLFSAHAELKQWDGRDRWQPLPTTEGKIGQFAVHPDDRHIAVRESGKLRIGFTDRKGQRSDWTVSHPCGRIAYSPDGRLLAIESEAGVKLLDARLGDELMTLPNEGTSTRLAVHHLSFAAQGTLLVTMDDDNRLRLWQTSTGRLAYVSRAFAGDEPRVAVSDRDNRLAVIAGTKLFVYETRFGGPSRSLALQPGEIDAFDVSPDGGTLATVGHCRSDSLGPEAQAWQTAFWNLESGRRMHDHSMLFTAHPARPGDETAAMAFCPNGEDVFVAMPSLGTFSLPLKAQAVWNSTEQPQLGRSIVINPTAFTTEGRVEVIRTEPNRPVTLRLSAGQNESATVTLNLKSDKVSAWPGDRWLLLARVHPELLPADGTVLVTNCQMSGRKETVSIPRALLPEHAPSWVTLGVVTRQEAQKSKVCHVQLKLSPTTAAAGIICLEECIAVPYAHAEDGDVLLHNAAELRVSPDGSRLSGIVRHSDQIATWTGAQLSLKGLHDQTKLLSAMTTGMVTIHCLDVGNHATVAGLRAGNVLICSADDSAVVREVAIPGSHPIRAVALARDESRIAVGTLTGQVFWLDHTGRILSHWEAHPEGIVALAVSHAGDRLVTLGADQTSRLWKRNGDRFDEFLTLPAGPRPPRSLRWTGNGRLLAIGHQGGRAIQIVDLEELRSTIQKQGISW